MIKDDSHKKRIIASVVSLIIVGISLVICSRYSSMIYMTDDDTAVQNTLNGFNMGECYPIHQYISVFWGYPLALLYRSFPQIQWWYTVSLLLMSIGVFLVNRSILTIAMGNIGDPHGSCYKTLTTYFSLIVFNVIFVLPALALISFTIVPSLYGAGTISLVLLKGYGKDLDKHMILTIPLLFLPVIFHRKETAYAVLPYLLLAILWAEVRNNSLSNAIKKWLLYSVAVITVSGAFILFDTLYQNRVNGDDFVAFNKARAVFMGYSIDTYDENPSLYSSVGWDKDTYIMASSWCFIDERISADSMRTIAENSITKTPRTDLSLGGVLPYFGIGLCFIASCIILYFAGDNVGLFFEALNTAGTVLLIAYQYFTGRIMYRSIIVVLIPAFVLGSIILLSSKELEQLHNKLSPRIDRYGYVFMIIIMLCTVYVSGDFVDLRYEKEHRIGEAPDSVFQYIIDHKENTYIYEPLNRGLNPRCRFDQDVSNSICWGGSDYGCFARKLVLSKNGLDGLNDESFLKDNVYLISKKSIGNQRSCLPAFERWMSSIHPEYSLVKADEIDDVFSVYHFIPNES